MRTSQEQRSISKFQVIFSHWTTMLFSVFVSRKDSVHWALLFIVDFFVIVDAIRQNNYMKITDQSFAAIQGDRCK
jgi:hypothetical protein